MGVIAMRKNILLCMILAAAMIITPLTFLDGSRAAPEPVTRAQSDDGTISVMLTENGKVEKLDDREYVIGALAAEMDPEYHPEALKAQAVACYTYALYSRTKKSDGRFNGADVSDSAAESQGYLSKEQRQKKWGKNYETYEKKTEAAVDAVSGKKLMYNGEPVLAVYHDLNSGVTESAQTVWGSGIPYLQSVQSLGDMISPRYRASVKFSEENFRKKAQTIASVKLGSEPDKWIGNSEVTDSGFVKSIYIGGTKVSGGDLRLALGLKSCIFEIKHESGGFTVTTVGNGHLVGMSQYGADYMARQGATWEEILKHYYSGVEIC